MHEFLILNSEFLIVQRALTSSSLLRQREHRQRVGGGHGDVLLAVSSLIRDRIGISAPRELRHPQFLARPRVERAEAVVVGRCDEQQAAGRRDRRD